MNSRPKILFYVQHLLGIGHLMRAGTLTRALEAHGFETTLVSGGTPVPGFAPGASHFEQLSPTRATDKFFKVLVDENDQQIDDVWKAARAAALLEIYARTLPDVILIEMYPFGRRQMRFEIEPLIEAARNETGTRPMIVSSVRDILVEPGKPERVDEMVDRVRRYFDLVLIHGDSAFISFEETFPRMAEISDISRYTGYVADTPPPADPKGPGAGEVIVSTGGGAVSDDMLQAAIDARALSTLADIPWRVLIGHNLPDAEFEAYRNNAPEGVIVERSRTDFRQLLANCTLSISQGGYNTVMEILAAGTRSVCIPYAGGLESEQTLRCNLLADKGALEVVDPGTVTAQSVNTAISRVLNRAGGIQAPIDMSGAKNTAAILQAALNQNQISE